MSDEVGLIEHANGAEPAVEHGYCVDDISRGLAIICREPAPSAELVELARIYLHFLAEAQAPDGRFINRMGYDRTWNGEPTTEDHWGRALWGLGTAASRAPDEDMREEARARFERGARLPSPYPHAMSFAALGAAEVLDAWPGHPGALALLARASEIIGEPPEDPAWPWPAARLTYGNGSYAEAMIAAGDKLGDEHMLRDGLRMLHWLLTVETSDGRLSVTPCTGWGPGDPRPGFDQQPIEVAAIADACVRAADVTGDDSWLTGTSMCVAWYLGENDSGVVMINDETGGGYDGLKAAIANPNQGAESTLAMISVLQHGRTLSAA
jgi:hypothetical protein